jgi:uncharacterized FlgJ-related protein
MEPSSHREPSLAVAIAVTILALVLGCGSSDDAADASSAQADETQATETATAGSADSRRFEFTSYQDIVPLAEELGYTAETWRAGVREVPRLYLTNIPPRWKDRVSQEVAVQIKKRIFFRLLAPLALHANELILEDRARAEALGTELRDGKQLGNEDRQWLGELATRYGVIDEPSADLDASNLDELMARVDMVPISLALAQSAEESGWGTSRFAAEGNALFGQWTWSKKGIKPEGQRSTHGDHRIAAFETPLQSVMAYLHNLNTHNAYRELRARRAKMRANGERMSGWKLAEALTRYSERGEEYVKSLHAIMSYNQLDPADDAYLADGTTIYLVPVGDGSE